VISGFLVRDTPSSIEFKIQNNDLLAFITESASLNLYANLRKLNKTCFYKIIIHYCATS